MTTFLNTEEDSELRIHAYIAIMQCPTESAIFQIKEMLANEPVNQVGENCCTIHLLSLCPFKKCHIPTLYKYSLLSAHPMKLVTFKKVDLLHSNHLMLLH